MSDASDPYLYPGTDVLRNVPGLRNAEQLAAFEAVKTPLACNPMYEALDHSGSTAVANRVGKTPAQVALAWAIQRGTAPLTTSKTPSRIKENFEVSTLPEDAMREINEGIKSRVRFNAVVETGVPGFIPRGK